MANNKLFMWGVDSGETVYYTDAELAEQGTPRTAMLQGARYGKLINQVAYNSFLRVASGLAYGLASLLASGSQADLGVDTTDNQWASACGQILLSSSPLSIDKIGNTLLTNGNGISVSRANNGQWTIGSTVTLSGLGGVSTTTYQQGLATKQDNLTSGQLSAVNSGITSEKVAAYDGYATTIAGKQNAITSENKLSASLIATDTSSQFVSSSEKQTWDAKSDFSGDYDDLTNKPTIPSGDSLVSSSDRTNWNGKQDAISDLAGIRSDATAGKSASDTIETYGNIVTHNTSEFATASQGAKADTAVQPSTLGALATKDAVNYETEITNKPTIPTVNDGVLTISVNNVQKGTFTANQSGDTSVNIETPLPTYVTIAYNTQSISDTDVAKLIADTNSCLIVTGWGNYTNIVLRRIIYLANNTLVFGGTDGTYIYAVSMHTDGTEIIYYQSGYATKRYSHAVAIQTSNYTIIAKVVSGSATRYTYVSELMDLLDGGTGGAIYNNSSSVYHIGWFQKSGNTLTMWGVGEEDEELGVHSFSITMEGNYQVVQDDITLLN